VESYTECLYCQSSNRHVWIDTNLCYNICWYTHTERDTIQLVEYLLENVVTKFWNELQSVRNNSKTPNSGTNDDGHQVDGDVTIRNSDEVHLLSNGSKQLSNLVLVICYMYNFGVVHCTLLYDIIRRLIEHCYEMDVELLLLLLNHCGRTLRSDDPNALKEIMSLVQQKQSLSSTMNTSRAQYMVDTLMELKKTKRRKQDQPLAEQTLKLRKVLGHIKSFSTSKGRTNITSSDSSLRITLQDILDVDTKGRWWKVGASWAGGTNPSQLLHGGSDAILKANKVVDSKMKILEGASKKNDLLLQLAAKYRMNTDARRTIFCIIMGGTDFEDCFEKLVRAGMIKNRSERDTVRVLIECCCNEKAFNPYYAHLAARICDYQPQCKFTFQLAFWDAFKQLHDYKPRKVANLAKLLFHLVAIHQCLKINVIKVIDTGTPEQLSESALIFVTIFLSSILEHFDNPQDTYRLFQKGTRYKNGPSKSIDQEEDNDSSMYEGDNSIQASVTIFLVQVLKASPKYQKGSKFRTNLKAAIKACDTDNFF
jgi:nucleolar MIF4G domain-containing protein 1